MSSRERLQGQNLVIVTRQSIQQPRQPQGRYRRMRPLTVLLSLLALIALAHMIAIARTADTIVTPTDCTGLIRSTDYTRIVHLQSTSQEMEAVQFVNQLTNGQPSALVQVTNTGPQHALDVYIYGCTMRKDGPRLTVLFRQGGLMQGTATVSSMNTLITSQFDSTLSPEASTLVQPLQQNIYREYAWRNGTFVQIPFPGLYPVTNRSEAEQLQQLANNGEAQSWRDPLVTAEQMATDILKWSGGRDNSASTDSVLSNDGTTAQVLLVHQQPHIEVTVKLARLIQHDNTGLWFVVSAQTKGITLNQPDPSHPTTSPLTIQGTGALTDGQTTTTLFDHTLTPIDTLNNATLNVDASGAYTGTIYYTHTVLNQQGLLLIQSLPVNNDAESGQLLLTSIILR